MEKTIYVLILAILISSCRQTNSKSEDKANNTQTNKIVNINKPSQATEKLNSINKANNESIIAAGDNITKAFVFLKDGDSTINLTANIRKDHRIFGYSKPDNKSERLLLLSVFTNDVENNPFECKLGAYYDTRSTDKLTLKYNSITGDFIKAVAIDKTNKSTTIYFEKKWINFE